jgi:hypothetical protein
MLGQGIVWSNEPKREGRVSKMECKCVCHHLNSNYIGAYKHCAECKPETKTSFKEYIEKELEDNPELRNKLEKEERELDKPETNGSEESWEDEFDTKWERVSAKGGFINPLLGNQSKAYVKSFIRSLLHEQNKRHAAEIAACESNYDQMKTDYEAQLKKREQEVVRSILGTREEFIEATKLRSPEERIKLLDKFDDLEKKMEIES